MKTPDEIKKGILCDGPCNECPYRGRMMSDGGCSQAVTDDTIDYIQQLESRLAQAEWISVEDRLPEKEWEDNQKWFSETVLAATGGSVLYGCFEVYKFNGTWEFVSYDEDMDFDRCVTVTHWMPLPEPPKEDAE